MTSKKKVTRKPPKQPARPPVDSPQHDTTSSRERDETFLRQTLDLARKGIGLTSPNPSVGSVIVDPQGHIIGEGFHTFDQIKHAEVLDRKSVV